MTKENDHPSTELLSAYSLGQLSPAEASEVEQHISRCNPCCETMAGLPREDTFVGLLQEACELPGHSRGGSRSSDAESDQPEMLLADHARYEIVDAIGRGGMGRVFKARHRMMDREVAVKVIHREWTQKPEAIERFHREVKAAASLAHPNIVTAYDAEQVGELHLLVMEYVEGVDLARTVQQNGPLPVEKACDYVLQAAMGLEAAHQSEMVHRDIKPHNLMLTDDGQVKILDFGLASLGQSVGPAGSSDLKQFESSLTAAGAVMGTPDFIAPEQAVDARKADIRSDIYSLGMSLYYLLAGRAPFTTGGPQEKLKAQAEQQPDCLGELRSDLPDGLLEVLGKMTAKQPDQRYQSPAEVVVALSRFVDDTGSGEANRSLQTTSQGSASWMDIKTLVGAAFAFCVLVAASIVYFIQTDKGVIRLKLEDEDLRVSIQGGLVTIEDPLNPIQVWAGDYRLKIRNEKTGFEFESKDFAVTRNDQLLFEVELMGGQLQVTENGRTVPMEQAESGEHLLAEGHRNRAPDRAARRRLMEDAFDQPKAKRVPAEIVDGLALALSEAAGIDSEQWGRFKTTGTRASIQGEPLSLVLGTLNPDRDSARNINVLKEFRSLGGSIDQNRIHSAFRKSLTDNYYSLIHPENIEIYNVERQGKQLKGVFHFRVPQVCSGLVEFIGEIDGGAMRVMEFSLPQNRVRVACNKAGLWTQQELDLAPYAPQTFDFRHVPTNAIWIFGLRPMQTRTAPELGAINTFLNGNPFWLSLLKYDVQQMVLVTLPGEEKPASQCVVLRLEEDNATAARRKVFGEGDEVDYGKRTRLNGWAHSYLDQNHIVCGPPEDVVDFLQAMDRDKRKVTNSFAETLFRVEDSTAFVIANTKELGAWPREFEWEFRNPFAPIVKAIKPLWRTSDYLSFSVDLSEREKLRLAATCRNQLQLEAAWEDMARLPMLFQEILSRKDGINPAAHLHVIGRETKDELVKQFDYVDHQKTTSEAFMELPLQDAMPMLLRDLDQFVGRTQRSQVFEQESANTSGNNLRTIASLIQQFELEEGRLPSVKNKPPKWSHPYSWRVALLKYFDAKLYASYHSDEPWDSENNLKLLDKMPEIYRHPSQDLDATTSAYVLACGEGTAIGTGTYRPTRGGIKDGHATTALVIESKASNIPWTKPEDLDITKATNPGMIGGFEGDGYFAAFADGNVRYISDRNLSNLRAMASANGKESLSIAADGQVSWDSSARPSK